MRRRANRPESCCFFLYLAVQVQFICHNVTFYIYNIWFAGMLQWDYTWGDILGYGLLMLLFNAIVRLGQQTHLPEAAHDKLPGSICGFG